MTKTYKEYITPFIDARLQNQIRSNECQCDNCTGYRSSESGNHFYYGQEITIVKKIQGSSQHFGRVLWVFNQDINYTKLNEVK